MKKWKLGDAKYIRHYIHFSNTDEFLSADEFLSSHVLANAARRLFNSKAKADLTLHIGDHALPAHSAILVIQSEYFEAALRQDLLEKEIWQFHFNEDSPYAFWRVLEFAYIGEYSTDIETLGSPDDDALIRAVKICVLADYEKSTGRQKATATR
ncbi:hypothetical protein BR93DRAFT_391294 [Coniochaeta sp. PMI_546]|nr:hypothetical protein BR93DRAFT_391294 [Coniochaeta sp. PMI_546]